MISPTYGQLELKEVVNKIADYINKNGNNVKYKFIIGTDSQVYGNNIVYVTVVACCCVGHGGIYFYDKSKIASKVSLQERLYTEASLSLEFASKFMTEITNHGEHLDTFINLKSLEIHVDVGVDGESRAVIQGAVGMIKGSGYNVKIKPDAYTASCIADKHTKNVNPLSRAKKRQLKKEMIRSRKGMN